VAEGQDDPVLAVETPIGLRVVCSAARWHMIVSVKHPVMGGRLGDVAQTLAAPEEIRQSVRDESVVLFYRRDERRWTCAVVKRLDGEGFLITCYPTDRIKSGDILWTR